MLSVNYKKLIPYSFDVVLSQYFDYEHIEHVHPKTLGRYELVEKSVNDIVYRQHWPRGLFGSAVSTVRHTFNPPGEIWFDFIEGKYKGVKVHTLLRSEGKATLVDETYQMPLPNWRWLGALARPFVIRQVERVWKEDIDVDVCRDGWPRVPETAECMETGEPKSRVEPVATRALKITEITEGEPKVVELADEEVAVFRQGDRCFALEQRCPHTGGPLSLGKVEDGAVVCPWHGAKFDLQTGAMIRGPAKRGVRVFACRIQGGEVQIETGEAISSTTPAE